VSPAVGGGFLKKLNKKHGINYARFWIAFLDRNYLLSFAFYISKIRLESGFECGKRPKPKK